MGKYGQTNILKICTRVNG